MDVSLKEHLETMIDLRFQAQDRAVQAALTAQEKSTNAAFASSEKAITKAEEAQKAYNATHNDLSHKMDEQYKAMMPREESLGKHGVHETRIQELKEDASSQRAELKEDVAKLRTDLMREISSLRESRSEGAGEKGGKVSQQQLLMLIVSLVVALIVIGGAVVGIAYAIRKG